MSFESVRRSRRMAALAGTKFLTKAEIARRWGVSAATVRRAIERGELPTVRVGQRNLVAENEWLRYAARESA